jgi:signal transduction histidine kinase
VRRPAGRGDGAKVDVFLSLGPWLLLGVGVSALEILDMLVLGIGNDHPYPVAHVVIRVVAPLAALAGRWFPLTAFLCSLLAFAAETTFPAVIALYAVVLHRKERWLAPACTVLYLVAVFAYLQIPIVPRAHLVPWPMLLGALTPVFFGILIRTRRELAAKILELEESREREATLLTAQVLAGERARLARELHDVIAHQVALISVQAGALQVTSTDPAARDTARTVRTLAGDTMVGLRGLLGVLRTPGPEASAPRPALADLPQLISDTGLAATFRPEIPLAGPHVTVRPDAVQHAVFRTVQEGLTNAAKHAPGGHVTVRLYEAEGRLHVTVRTAPPPAGARPLDLPASGYGLTGLDERARLAGGTLTARSQDDGSHLLAASFPSPALAPTGPGPAEGHPPDTGRCPPLIGGDVPGRLGDTP